MPRQLIYTSAPRGLVPGQSGYCTVARSRDLREALISRLEKLSYYTPELGDNPVICAYRILEVRGDRYQVLTRIVAAGLDFTRRSRFLAHHLIFDAAENISPAQIFIEWQGWQNYWEGEPQWIDDQTAAPLPTVSRSPQTLQMPPGGVWILGELSDRARFLQTLAIFASDVPFTSFYQPGDQPSDFELRAVWPGTSGYEEASRLGAEFLTLDQLAAFPRETQKSAPPLAGPTIATAAKNSEPPVKLKTFPIISGLGVILACALLGWAAATLYRPKSTSSNLSVARPPLSLAASAPKQNDELTIQFQSKPTWLVLLSTNGVGAPASIPNLQRLFKQLQDSEIFGKDIAALLQADLNHPAAPAHVDADLAAGALRCIANGQTQVALKFNGIVEARAAAPFALEIAGVRLLIIPGGAPLELPRRWLAVEEGREAVSLAADLEKRLRQITLPASAELALRPTADPLVGMQKEFSIQPSTSLELLALRADVAKILAEKEKSIAAMKAEKGELDVAGKKVITQGPDAEVKLRRERMAALGLALPKAAAELKSLREKEALIPETLRGISAFSLFLCQSNVNSEIIRFTEGAAP